VLAVEDPERLRGQRFAVSSGMVIGRGPDCAICLSDEYVSSNHARLFEREGALWVEDLHSANGTLLNGQRLRQAGPLRVGDRLAVGAVVLILREAS
jgi:pSer/pThr/pTyr-binding forkhead associated (FHA) protein